MKKKLIVFCILEDKSDLSYTMFSKKLLEIKPDLKPRTIMTDFEKAAMNAGLSLFTQSYKSMYISSYKKYMEVYSVTWFSGLYKAPVSNEEATQQFNDDCKKHLKYLFAIAFVPVKNVVKLLSKLKETLLEQTQ
ncbi:hypothetical protein BpHYR1_048810 [Brachionus plicatilis]|uniref:MULE transposase domain-containing protein n=1 Tax=Brachionus plicatilis TaxID=10195 RepID=A0A3M7SNM3_BRAPC|nr:hypothetical protein BpHYR1_048810 [Brachionus plicatilis]